MPPASKFEGEHRLRRWSAHLGQFVGEGKITPTALNASLGGSHAVSRVSRWLRGERGVGEDTAWEVGHALRRLGADTNEIEALWAAGFFAALFRLLQQIASEPNIGTHSAARLYSVLPARMLVYETRLCEGIAEAAHGVQCLQGYHELAKGKPPYTTEGKSPSLNEPVGDKFTLDAYNSERFERYQNAWERVCRGDRPAAAPRTSKYFRGDDDLIDVLCDAANRMKERWIPSLLIVRLWRIAMEWADELEPVERTGGYGPRSFCGDFELIPDLFLPTAAANEREAYVDVIHHEWAMEAHYNR